MMQNDNSFILQVQPESHYCNRMLIHFLNTLAGEANLPFSNFNSLFKGSQVQNERLLPNAVPFLCQTWDVGCLKNYLPPYDLELKLNSIQCSGPFRITFPQQHVSV